MHFFKTWQFWETLPLELQDRWAAMEMVSEEGGTVNTNNANTGTSSTASGRSTNAGLAISGGPVARPVNGGHADEDDITGETVGLTIGSGGPLTKAGKNDPADKTSA